MTSLLGRLFSSPLKQQTRETSDAQSPSMDKPKPLYGEDGVRSPFALGVVRRQSAGLDSPRGQPGDGSSSPAPDDDDASQNDDEPDDVNMADVSLVPPSATKFGLLSPQVRRPPARSSAVHAMDLDNNVDERGEGATTATNDDNHDNEDDEDKQYMFTDILDHRWAGSAIEVKVAWDKGEATWEPEENLHRDAPESLFAYWKSAGGRPLNPVDPELFVIFAIRKHSSNKKRLLVEWLGYDASEHTWLPVAAVEETASEVVAEYWEGVKNKKKKGGKRAA
ncbi:hypothetical protein B0J13DRAFT_323101 [Dactylonectria estremocensis]|uniref:Chromo domain-containing protein n=1 Tax=Dactylonectria estremocensis TaxID=1079267 RepID=A0A9P9J6W8_9HYPO|nr:hypothetical protein B0J13DRAFT_323101 [Dactylonectria estremocensis]